jgi:hypothetical protein
MLRQPGDKLGPYEILELIGAGAWAKFGPPGETDESCG